MRAAYARPGQRPGHPLPGPSPRRLCHTGPAGVITATDLGGLVELCRQNQCWLELTVGVGEYLAHGTPVALAQRSLLEAAAGAALPVPFTAVASAADREGLG